MLSLGICNPTLLDVHRFIGRGKLWGKNICEICGFHIRGNTDFLLLVYVIQLALYPEAAKCRCLRNSANHVTNYSNNTNDSSILEFVAVYKNTGIS